MKAITAVLAAAISCLAFWQAHADPVLESVQRSLKERGFYYGEVTGQSDADTAAALRRFQIRNGLKITGDLNAETQKALGVKGVVAESRVAPPPPIKAVPPASSPAPANLRDPAALRQEQASSTQTTNGVLPDALIQQRGGLFEGTALANAGPEVQGRVVVGAQARLARQGLYRDEIDGVYGAGTAFALRAFQARFGIVQSGRLDTETLALLGLLPGQRAPGLTAPRRHGFRRAPSVFVPRGERIYIPR